MKRIKEFYKVGVFAVILGMLTLISCKDDLPSALDTTSNMTELKSIKIINAGANGDVVIEGTIDEASKMVSFPRIDPETDFSALKFEAEVSEGAKLDKESYTVAFGEGASEEVITVKVMNEPRYREYLVSIRLRVPVFGADFDNATVYDYSANPIGNPAYPSFVGLSTRGTGFDGEHVLILDRGSAGAHLLKVSDLKDNVINRITLNTEGVTGGTYPYNMGAQINGHTYIASLSTSGASPLKIYHWTDPSATPEVVANINVGSIASAGARHGDNVSFNLDANGNGFVYFISLQGPVLRLTVANYTQFSDPMVIQGLPTYGQWSSYLQIGQTDSYLVTGNAQTISVVNASGTVAHTMGSSSVPVNGGDARVITFNGERYLMVVTVARTGSEFATLYLFDITRGETDTEALRLLEQSGQGPVYEHNMTSATNIAPGAQTGWTVIKDTDGNDQTLVLYAAHSDAGFAIIELPKKQLED